MRSRWVDSERGSVTAELAVTLPAVALVLAACLTGVRLVGDNVRLVDAAADAAPPPPRGGSPGAAPPPPLGGGAGAALGRGESEETASAIVARVYGSAALAVTSVDSYVCVTLTATGSGILPGIQLSAQSCALTGGL